MQSGPQATPGRFRALYAGLGVALAIVLVGVLGATVFPAMSGPDPMAGPAAAVTGVHNDTHTPFNIVSMPALIDHGYDVSPLRFTGSSTPGRGFVRHAISYRSDGLDLTGTLVLPNRRAVGGAPVIVTVHGWRPVGEYLRGTGLIREENALARAGFAVLHPDLRNYGGSSVESGDGEQAHVGYPADVIAAVLALRQSTPGRVDTSRIGLLGRSMGGGAALQAAVARPDLFDALELYSPVSSLAADNFERFSSWTPGLAGRVADNYGTPAGNPATWLLDSSRTYVDRLTMPVRIDHGADDNVTDPDWSRATVRAMRAAGVDAELVVWPGEQHRFDRSWQQFVATTVQFFSSAVR